MKPYFSIIIPAYNASTTIEGTLNSVANQSFKDFEIIVINDGSTDDTLSRIKGFKNRHPELYINIVDQKNKGLGASRNIGIQKATGAYIALLDADDTWYSDKLNICKSTIDQTKADVVYHSMKSIVSGKEFVREARKHLSATSILTEGCSIIPSATLLKTEVAKQNAFSTNLAFHGVEDLDLWIRLYEKDKNIRFFALPKTLGYYHEATGMSKNVKEHIKNFRNVLKHFLIQQLIDKSTYTKAIKRKYFEFARFFHKRKKYRSALKYYLKSPKTLKIKVFEFLAKIRIRG